MPLHRLSSFSHRLVLAVLALLCAGTGLYAADEAFVPASTTLGIGQRVRIAVTGSLSTGGNVALTVRFNPSVCRIVRAEGAEGFALRCTSPEVRQNTPTDARTAEAVVICPFSVGITNVTLVILELEGVIGIDTVGSIGVVGITANDVPVIDAQVNVGTVTRTGGIGAIPSTVEGFVGNYPNPFGARTRVAFVVEQPGPVRFALCSSQGRVVEQFGPYEAVAGENAIDLEIISWQVSSGAYLLRMDTERGTYFHPVTVMK